MKPICIGLITVVVAERVSLTLFLDMAATYSLCWHKARTRLIMSCVQTNQDIVIHGDF
jgi:hypothetical protein